MLQLLVDFRRRDYCEKLAFFDMRPYIKVPMFQITVRSRENRRRDIRLDVSRQHNLLRRCGLLRLNNRNGGYRQIRGFSAQRGACVDALENAENQNSGEN